jgi:hypothetical protein
MPFKNQMTDGYLILYSKASNRSRLSKFNAGIHSDCADKDGIYVSTYFESQFNG